MTAVPDYSLFVFSVMVFCAVTTILVLLFSLTAKWFGTKTAIIAWSCLLFVPVGLVLLGTVSYQARRVETTTTVVESRPAEQPAVWADVDPAQFTADLYPNLESALEALAYRIKESPTARPIAEAEDSSVEQPPGDSSDPTSDQPAEVPESPAPPESPSSIVVSSSFVDGGDLPALDRFKTHLQQRFPHSTVSGIHVAEEPATVNDGEMTVHLSTINRRTINVLNSHDQQQAGEVRCRIRTAHHSAATSVRYVEKPWVEHLDVYLSRQPHRQLIVGYSGDFASSEDEARRMALHDARSRATLRVNGTILVPDESNVVDRFVQQLSRPYGNVWREAVLMDVSASRLKPQIRMAQRRAAESRRSEVSAVVGIVLLFGTAIVLCTIFNSLTQGYYQNRLWIMGSVAFVVAAAVTMLFVA